VQNFSPIGKEIKKLYVEFRNRRCPRKNAMHAWYTDHSEKSTNGVGAPLVAPPGGYWLSHNYTSQPTPLHSAWTESRTRDAGSVSGDRKGVPTVKTLSATKAEEEIWRS